MDHQGLVLGLEPYYERPKSIQEVLQRFSLSLIYTEEVERNCWSGLVNNELFYKQFGKLVEGGYVAIRKANKPL